ncbi:D-alanyl-D-alanine carboxypeptidase/D-alanyl-D-alanine endopeptidase [Methylotenera mobilis]|uniref:D-alanyl-D-alanine carboxypeptidase/D-alanyl-D-alanine-endopeptidase n=1 Tax=Methylotenera mobilis (strain JLW8 / ATCC BAA-1282 / DSM 17540) TaxID=583345 RepID=C6WTM3_METML|nr:D-alanyl-D-alanine carboxypeptidase/D-alanyl-D-alanine-endopeptidase [Methylotenera mobilis]ACT47345.1 D-alanyl-D-alanine carboxypeptidase/D-alanyl-D-alanine-endopeptidase [Methylotenera mobilis JLW8]
MKKFTFIVSLMLLSGLAHAELPKTVAAELAQSGVPASDVSIYVQAVDSRVPILSHYADKSMNPASVMKMVTTNAALDLLTPAYRWKTELYQDGLIKDGVLNGNLIIKGYGDPSFKVQDFWRLLMSLKQAGVEKINGDLLIDKSYFADDVDNGVSFDDEKWRAYNAKPSAFSVNGRSTSFRFLANEIGVSVNQEFELPEVAIVNHMKRVDGDCGNWRGRMSYDIQPYGSQSVGTQNKAAKAVVSFKGIYAADCGERYIELSLFDDTQYAFFTFKKLWRELGGSFDGKLKLQPVPANAKKLLEQASEPLGTVVRDINKWSNNLMARQLLLTLGAEKSGAPATMQKGAAAIQDWLSTNGLSFKGLVIENGSGLSRVERISAEHLGKMLVRAYLSPVMPEYMASMPILSLDGTVKHRLEESAVNGRAHLKTGSINGVSSIAGYVLSASGHRYVMVMLVNHPNAGASRDAQDALVEWVHRLP